MFKSKQENAMPLRMIRMVLLYFTLVPIVFLALLLILVLLFLVFLRGPFYTKVLLLVLNDV